MRALRQADWFVNSVEPQRDYSLIIKFANGETRRFDASGLLSDSFFSPLKSLDFFMLAHRQGHSVVWNDEIDIAPEYLFENSSAI